MRRGKRMLVVGLVAASTVPLVLLLRRGPAGEILTAERLAAARALWKERGPRSYALDIEAPDARHHVEVSEGKVVRMTTNGAPVREGASERWTVEGMFGFLSEELSNRQRPEAAFGVSDPSDVVLRAGFDAKNGFPARFLRHVQGQAKSFEWKATLAAR
jgi:hypothetical protein